MSISANYPNVRPSLLLDFANSQQLDPRITFSRSTTAPYYDGKTSVLAEQNLVLYSQLLTNGNWLTSGCTPTANSVVAPDGTTTGNLLTIASSGFCLQQISVVAGTTYTASFYALAGTSTTVNYFVYNVTNSSNIVSTVNYYPSINSSTWTRISFSFTVPVGCTSIYLDLARSSGAGTVYLWGAQLEQRSSATAYNATTTSALTNYIPQLLTAPINQPRFDFNPVTGESLGLLIEQSSTNLLTYSQDFSNAAWTKGGATITNTSNIAPDGTQTMQTLVEDTSTGVHRVFNVNAFVTSTSSPTTYCIYAKSAGRNIIQVTDNDNVGSFFDLSSGTVTSGTGTITPVGNNLYRCTISRTNSTVNGRIAVYLVSTGTTTSYTGNGYSGVYIWGSQAEALAFQTSYIPTTSAQVTRASDNASMTGTNFSSWYNIAEGTMFAEASTVSTGNACVYGIGDSTSNIIRMFKQSGNQAAYQVVKDATFSANLGMATTWTSGFAKVCSAYKTDDFATSYNGGTSLTDTSGAVPTVNTVLTIGIGAGVSSLNGYIKKIAYYPIRVTNAQLQALTGS